MKTRRRYATVTYPRSDQREVTEGIETLAHKRTEHLHRMLAHRTAADLLANAYLQGMTDALETAGKHPEAFR